MQTSKTNFEDATNVLVSALLADRGLEYLTEAAAKVLKNPILVVDPTYHNAARAGFELTDDDESAFAQVTRQELAGGDSMLDMGVRYVHENGLDEKLAHSKAPVTRMNEIYGLNTMTSSITVHGTCLGRAMMIEHDHAFGEADEEVFSLFVRLAGQELQKTGFLTLGGPQQGSYFLGRLLDDEHPNPMSTERRMQLVGFTPLPSLFVLCIRAAEGVLSTRSAESIRGQLQPLLHHSLVTLYEGELVALVSRTSAPNLPDEADVAQLARIASANDLLIGISNTYSEATDTRAHLAQARAAIRYGSTYTKILDDTHVYRYCDYTYMEMLDICNDHVNLINYVHPSVWVLYEHDQAHDSELLETLFAYMQNGCNTARTAALLNLHKNTLLYRMNRIKELTGNDLASGEDLFLFHISIRTLIFLGFFEPRTKPHTSQDLHNPKA